MIKWAEIIKAAAIIAAIGYIIFAIHNNGRIVERAEWVEKERDRIKAQGDELRSAMQRIADQKKNEETYHAKILNESNSEIARLNSELANAYSVRIAVEESSCDPSAMPGESTDSQERDNSSGKPGSRDKGRVPKTVYATKKALNDGLTDTWEELERLKIFTKKLLAECERRFEVVE